MCKRTSLLSHACATLYATLCAVCQDVVMFSSTHSACVRLTIVEVHARDGSSSRPTHGKKPTHRDSRVCCRVLPSRYILGVRISPQPPPLSPLSLPSSSRSTSRAICATAGAQHAGEHQWVAPSGKGLELSPNGSCAHSGA